MEKLFLFLFFFFYLVLAWTNYFIIIFLVKSFRTHNVLPILFFLFVWGGRGRCLWGLHIIMVVLVVAI
jgi:hypothetical protein